MGVLLFTISALFVLWTPFTKVEESFNMQATHDILVHSYNISEYDHLEFPGVVPRTFIGPLMLSTTVSPIFAIIEYLEGSKVWAQYLIRFAMAVFVCVSWHLFRKTLIEKFGLYVGAWFTVITITQFHFLFYMSRLLPNILALPLTLLGVRAWIRRDIKSFICSAGCVIIIFRSELCILFGLLLLYDVYYKRITVPELLKIAIPAGIILLLLTVTVDSIFWQRPLWPEAEVFWYNTVMNKSKEWGTSPFLWYFYSALPRALGASVVFVPFGLYFEPRIRALVIPALCYILLYSFLPHKELRFVIYVFPLLNVASACACCRLWQNRHKSLLRGIIGLIAASHLLLNCLLTMFLLLVSSTNYPGGVAISRLHRLAPSDFNVTIHIGNLAAQTGVTRFLQTNKHWKYNKDEYLKPGDPDFHEFDYLLVEAKDKYSTEMRLLTQTHNILEFIECFSNIGLQYDSFLPIKIKTKPCIYIMERKPDAPNFLELTEEEEIDESSIDMFIEKLSKTLDIDEKNNKEVEMFSQENAESSEVGQTSSEASANVNQVEQSKTQTKNVDTETVKDEKEGNILKELKSVRRLRDKRASFENKQAEMTKEVMKETKESKETESQQSSKTVPGVINKESKEMVESVENHVNLKTFKTSEEKLTSVEANLFEEDELSSKDIASIETSEEESLTQDLPQRKTRIREIFKDHFKRVNVRTGKQSDGELTSDISLDSPKNKIKKIIKSEQIKALVEDIQKLEICDPKTSPKDCLKLILDEYMS